MEGIRKKISIRILVLLERGTKLTRYKCNTGGYQPLWFRYLTAGVCFVTHRPRRPCRQPAPTLRIKTKNWTPEAERGGWRRKAQMLLGGIILKGKRIFVCNE